ncbi:hypothetical protein CCOS2040_12485 [Streptomyces albidoflavus]|uniref:Uncharacterized protein n=1 Tax=Streptomyces albidoflavus TaxID=1886 RepID=A0AA37BZM8_9ACTN|nr:hypothetical protein ScoT_38410 [Streptomyces albidoflavus]CAI4163743.1 hypothetical protein CCOS2040_12485 [Streptomyces albidoflavus]
MLLVAAPEGSTALAAASPVPDAVGWGDINAFNYTWGGIEISLPRGCQLGHRIKGSGKRISYQAAAVQGGGLCAVKPQFCNWRIDFSYADTDGRTYKTSRGKTHNVCERYPERQAAKQTLPHYGKACAKIYVNSSLRGTQCHYIVK